MYLCCTTRPTTDVLVGFISFLRQLCEESQKGFARAVQINFSSTTPESLRMLRVREYMPSTRSKPDV
jgi:hypothetical protein